MGMNKRRSRNGKEQKEEGMEIEAGKARKGQEKGGGVQIKMGGKVRDKKDVGRDEGKDKNEKVEGNWERYKQKRQEGLSIVEGGILKGVNMMYGRIL